MRLQFRTSIASDRGAFADGQTIDVPAHTPSEIEAWLSEEPEFRAWIASGLVAVLTGPPGAEVAALDPLGQTATLPRTRPFRGRGRAKRSSVSAAAPA